MEYNEIYLCLYLLGISNKIILNIMNEVCEDELCEILGENYENISYKYNLELNKYHNKLVDTYVLSNVKNEAKIIQQRNEELGITMITYRDEEYPNSLREIDNPPAIIYVKGRGIKERDYKSIAIVGTRTPTRFGGIAAQTLSEKLTLEGFAIVSGLAKGIDTRAHASCIVNGGKTIAVLAHGLDVIYPKENQYLADKILNAGGALISQYPVGTKADKFRFVERNRIIAGLSRGVIVCEAKEKSGTMHTVEYAIEQGKKIFCPIPVALAPSTEGLYKLLKSGIAIGIQNIDEYTLIVNEIGYKGEICSRKNFDNNVNKEDNKNQEKLLKIMQNIGYEAYESNLDDYDTSKLYNDFKDIMDENNIDVKRFFKNIMYRIICDYKEGD